MPLFGGLIGAGVSLIGGLFGSSAASEAAKQKAQAGQAAAGAVNQATTGAINAGYAGITQANSAVNAGTAAANTDIANAGTAQQNIYNSETGTLQPYQAAGIQGLNNLQNTTGTFSFDPNNVTNNPAYQFQLKQGQQAIQNSAAARGMLQSGGTMKSLDSFSQGLASTSEQALYNQALGTFNTNQQGMQTLANLGQNANAQNLQAGSTYGGQLTSLAGLGANTNMQSAGDLSNVAQEGNQYIGAQGLQGATTAGNFTTGVGNAQAQGTVGAANAWSGAIGGIGGAATGYLSNLANTNPGGANGNILNYATTPVPSSGSSGGDYAVSNNPDGSVTLASGRVVQPGG